MYRYYQHRNDIEIETACPYCFPSTYPDKRSWQRHLRRHHPNQEKIQYQKLYKRRATEYDENLFAEFNDVGLPYGRFQARDGYIMARDSVNHITKMTMEKLKTAEKIGLTSWTGTLHVDRYLPVEDVFSQFYYHPPKDHYNGHLAQRANGLNEGSDKFSYLFISNTCFMNIELNWSAEYTNVERATRFRASTMESEVFVCTGTILGDDPVRTAPPRPVPVPSYVFKLMAQHDEDERKMAYDAYLFENTASFRTNPIRVTMEDLNEACGYGILRGMLENNQCFQKDLVRGCHSYL